MKDEFFPDIPQEQTPQSHSMYQQLRRTSQKWFTRSHKRIFDGRSSYLPNDSSKNSQSHQLILNNDQNNCQMPSDKSRMMQIMREQIQITCNQYTVKVKSLLQDQARYIGDYSRKIKILGELLLKNQNELKDKSRMIESISCSLMKLNQIKDNSTGNRFDVAEKKMKNLERGLQQIEEILASNLPKTKLEDIEKRFQNALVQLSETYFTRLDQVRYELEDRLDRAQKLNHLNLSATKGVKSSIVFNKQHQNIQKIIGRIHNELEDVRLEMEALQRKKFNYQNYQLNKTQEKLQKMEDIVLKLEANRKREDHCSTHTGWKGSQTTQLTHTEVNPLTKSASKSRFINRYKSLINNRKMREESYSSDDSSESQVEATLVEDQETNIQRFERVLEESKIPRPVLVEIDQTGYAKSVDTGMYLVDGTGNGFQFTISELEYLRTRGVIELK